MPQAIEHIDAQGERRLLMPPHLMKFGAAPVFGDTGTNTPSLVKMSEMSPTEFPREQPAIKNQGAIAACNPFSTIALMEFARAREGLPYVRLSPGFVHGNIGGTDEEGTSLQDAVSWMVKYGTVKAATIGELVWQKSKWPRGVDLAAEASQFRMEEYWLCPTADHIYAAVWYGFDVGMGVVWHQGDSDVGKDGWMPVAGGKVLGGHAFPGVRLVAPKSGSNLGLGCVNQWGLQYGDHGTMKMPYQRVVAECKNNYGIWAIRATTWTGQTLPTPKV